MIIFSIVLILLAGFPFLITLKRIRKYRAAQDRTSNTVATATHVTTPWRAKGLPYDRVTLIYNNFKTGRSEIGNTATVHNRYKPGDRVTIAYVTSTGKVIIPGDVAGFCPMLGFSIALLLFVLFAAFQLSEMLEAGF